MGTVIRGVYTVFLGKCHEYRHTWCVYGVFREMPWYYHTWCVYGVFREMPWLPSYVVCIRYWATLLTGLARIPNGLSAGAAKEALRQQPACEQDCVSVVRALLFCVTVLCYCSVLLFCVMRVLLFCIMRVLLFCVTVLCYCSVLLFCGACVTWPGLSTFGRVVVSVCCLVWLCGVPYVCVCVCVCVWVLVQV
jgi:hypothetical protein